MPPPVPLYRHLGPSRRTRRAATGAVTAAALVLGLLAALLAATSVGASAATSSSSGQLAHSARAGSFRPLGLRLSGIAASISGHVTRPSGSQSGDRVVVARNTVTGDATYTQLGSAGHYHFGNLLPGTYRVTFNRISGYAFAAAQFYSGVNEPSGTGSATVVDVTTTDATAVDATLVEGGHFTGHLVNADGQGLHCRLQAFTTDGSLVTRTGTSDSSGAFDITGLSSGTYHVRVLAGLDCATEQYGFGGALSSTGPGSSHSTPLGVSANLGTSVYAQDQVSSVTPPSVTGTPAVGSTLTADHGTWSPTPDGFTYQWLVDGVPVTGGTASTYTLTSGDAGKTVTVRVTASLQQFRSRQVETTGVAVPAPTVPVTPPVVTPPVVTPPVTPAASPSFTLVHAPALPKKQSVGSVLKADRAQTSMPATTVKYRWLRDGHRIHRATHRAYRVRARDAGHRLRLRMVFKRPGYPKIVTYSKATFITPQAG